MKKKTAMIVRTNIIHIIIEQKKWRQIISLRGEVLGFFKMTGSQ